MRNLIKAAYEIAFTCMHVMHAWFIVCEAVWPGLSEIKTQCMGPQILFISNKNHTKLLRESYMTARRCDMSQHPEVVHFQARSLAMMTS